MSATRHQSLEFYAVFDVRPDCEGRYYISSWKSHFRFYMLLNRDPYRNPPLEEVFAGSHNTLLFRERKREDSRMAKLEKFLLLKTNHRSRSHWDHRRHDEGYRRGGGGGKGSNQVVRYCRRLLQSWRWQEDGYQGRPRLIFLTAESRWWVAPKKAAATERTNTDQTGCDSIRFDSMAMAKHEDDGSTFRCGEASIAGPGGRVAAIAGARRLQLRWNLAATGVLDAGPALGRRGAAGTQHCALSKWISEILFHSLRPREVRSADEIVGEFHFFIHGFFQREAIDSVASHGGWATFNESRWRSIHSEFFCNSYGFRGSKVTIVRKDLSFHLRRSSCQVSSTQHHQT